MDTLPPLYLNKYQDITTFPNGVQIFTTLKEYLEPSSKTPATTAAQTISDLVPLTPPDEGKSTTNEFDNYLYAFWDMFIEISKHIPYDHPSWGRLFSVVGAFSRVHKMVIVRYLA